MNRVFHPLALAGIVLTAASCAMLPPDQSALDQRAARVNVELAAGYMRQGDFEIALDKLNKALSFDKNYVDAYNALGVLYEQTKRPQLAVQQYQRALEINPEHRLARLNYGRLLCETGNVPEGEAQVLRAADNPPANTPDSIVPQAYIAAALCARAVPDMERADTYLRKALALDPKSAEALYQLADLHYAQQDYLRARAFLQRYHVQAGFSPKSLSLGINIEEKLGNQQLKNDYTRLLLAHFAQSDEALRLQKTP